MLKYRTITSIAEEFGNDPRRLAEEVCRLRTVVLDGMVGHEEEIGLRWPENE